VKRTEKRRRGRPPAFSYRETRQGLLWRRSAGWVLHCDDVSLLRLAERFGTPLYVYSASLIREHVRIFERAFRKVPHTICYSVKANSNLSLLRLLAGLDCGFDVVSGGELERVLRADRRASRKVVFSGVGKTPEEMTAALKARIPLFNLESESELWTLAECAARSKEKARIALRVNPDVPANTHPYISTGLRAHKFGVPIGDARRLYTLASATGYLRVVGVSVHIGSQIMDMQPFTAAMERVADLVRELRSDGHEIKYVDAGGGLGIAYEDPNESALPDRVAAYADALLRPLRGLKVHLLLEPGRSIVGAAGALLTQAIYRKSNGTKNFLVVDAAMNDFLRPALYDAYHEIVPVRLREEVEEETVDVVGPVCESGDFLGQERDLPLTSPGDVLAVLDAGAYGMVLASNYNTRPRAAEVLVDGKSVRIIRRRETIEDLLRPES
jgi:diaminopimelate decarboxylase